MIEQPEADFPAVLPDRNGKAGAAPGGSTEFGATAGVIDELVVHDSDLALIIGHPAGLSRRMTSGRLGAALWGVFPGHVALLDRDGVVVSVNRAWREFGLANGATATTGLGMSYLDVCDLAAAGGDRVAEEAADLVRDALAGRNTEDRRVTYRAGLGPERWFSLLVAPILGPYAGALVVHQDVTADKRREQELRHRAGHDALTNVPNRWLLRDRLEHAVAGAGREPGSLAVLMLDLDHFKPINDRLGHQAGDAVLRETAGRIQEVVRGSDTFGRWEGDEFLVILERVDSPGAAAEVVERIKRRLRAPVLTGTEAVTVSVSVGVSYLQAGQTPDELLVAADDAMRLARMAGR